MRVSTVVLGVAFAVVLLAVHAQQQDADDEFNPYEKRAMRNALVRFGRAGMRNALVRFGKRSSSDDLPAAGDYANSGAKRNGAPQPFVRFGRSAGRIDHIHDILSTLQKIEMANSQ